tara:strand:- start:526 stop:1203 length:678 start_codon:yes stop_codon:yes gene_type:complete
MLPSKLKGYIPVKMYDEVFYINKETGSGFGPVIKKIEPLIFNISKSRYINGYSEEDLRQELSLIAIEGIRAFDESKGVKLSTFLHIHINNKILSKIRSVNKKSNNASSLKDSERTSDFICKEIAFTDVRINGDNDESDKFEDLIEDDRGGIYHIDNIDFNLFLEDLKGSIDRNSWLLIKYISQDGMSIKDASEKVGINIWNSASILKKLAKHEIIREFYESYKSV